MEYLIGLIAGLPPPLAVTLLAIIEFGAYGAIFWVFRNQNKENEKMLAAIKEQAINLTALQDKVAAEYAKTESVSSLQEEVGGLRGDIRALGQQIANLSNTVISAVSRK